jgi:uncharacterized protein (TIGR04255 family)
MSALTFEQPMAEISKPLPEFDSPPVIETVLGIEFAPLVNWGIPHFGEFWHEIKNDYPKFQVQPPLPSQIETFGKTEKIRPMISFQLVQQPSARCWFIHKSETRLLQVQNDRFLHNWRKLESAKEYPHYSTIRPIFEQEWKRFCDYLEAEEIGSPEVRQCEVTYINHIDRDAGWETVADLVTVIGSRIGAGSDEFLPVPETIGMMTSYAMPHEQGRLHIDLQKAVRHSDAAETMQLALTARGKPESSKVEDLRSWFDLGHEWIVRGFADFTTPAMHKLWRRRN